MNRLQTLITVVGVLLMIASIPLFLLSHDVKSCFASDIKNCNCSSATNPLGTSGLEINNDYAYKGLLASACGLITLGMVLVGCGLFSSNLNLLK
jgi:hypothetical protein